MKVKALCSIILLMMLGACNNMEQNSSEPKTQMKDLTELAELGTVEYTITKNVKANDNQAFYKFGDRKVLFSVKAFMKAGIDLKGFSNDKVKVDETDKSVTVTLPKASILSLNLPPEDAKVVYESVGTFRGKFSAADRTALLQQGEKAIMESVNELGILDEAESNARQFVKAFFKQAGFDNVTVNFE